mmetsp:Transcript_28692/g.95326  ORF Transcript_28692/g.95326 Transcript_28692/m.95326 type:complete len:261 (-) Transcript_28692:100-882(-)
MHTRYQRLTSSCSTWAGRTVAGSGSRTPIQGHVLFWRTRPVVFERRRVARCDLEEPKTLVLGSHAEELAHLAAVARRLVPAAPVARQAGHGRGLDPHVLHRAGGGRRLFPLGHPPGSRLPLHDNRYHVRDWAPPSSDFFLGHRTPILVLFLRPFGPASPSGLAPVRVVELERELLHLHHGLFAEHHKAPRRSRSVVRRPHRSVQQRLHLCRSDGFVDVRARSHLAAAAEALEHRGRAARALAVEEQTEGEPDAGAEQHRR